MSRTTTADQQQYQTLVTAQAQARAQWHAQAVAIAAAAAAEFTGWYDTAAITAWATALAQRIETLQRATAGTTDGYLARSLSMLTGRRVRPVGSVNVTSLRNGITHAGAYGRVADVYRYQQSLFDKSARDLLTAPAPEPFGLVTPIDAAVQRATDVADDDIQLADRAQSHATLTRHADRHDVRGYRRVIHPELSKGGTCGLCIAASDRIYHLAELKAIHAHCECTVLPIVGQHDPGSSLNNLDLNTLYQHGGSTGAADLKATRYKIDEHGELGPVLIPHAQQPRTARRARNDENRGGQAKPITLKRDQIERVRASLAAALPRAQDLAGTDPKKWGNYLTQLEARVQDLDHQLAAVAA